MVIVSLTLQVVVLASEGNVVSVDQNQLKSGNKTSNIETIYHSKIQSKQLEWKYFLAVWNRWTGLLDWNTGLEYWNGPNCRKSLFLDMTDFQKVVTHSVTSLSCFMPCLAVLPAC